MTGGRSPSHGALVARALAGAWREMPPDFPLTVAELSAIVPTVLSTGAGPLLWARLCGSQLRTVAAAEKLEQAYRYQLLRSDVYEHHLAILMRAMREADVQATVFKGWAVARHYADPSVRPLGDIDLVVPAPQLETARRVVQRSAGGWDIAVDLQDDTSTSLRGMSYQALCDRAETVLLGDIPIRVFSAEDHLGTLCVHFLQHAAWRPLWLTDIAAAWEHLPASFDWDQCLGSDRTRRGWILASLELARVLLDASPTNLPERSALRMPRWFLPTVVKRWNTPEQPLSVGGTGFPAPVASYVRRPSELWPALRLRWPDPIAVTVRRSAPLNAVPRLPFQLAESALRAKQFLVAARHTDANNESSIGHS